MQDSKLAFMANREGYHFLQVLGGKTGGYNMFIVIFVDLWILHLEEGNILYYLLMTS
jgi:hypothetical protein